MANLPGATVAEAYTVMETPDLIQNTRDIWRDELVGQFPEDSLEIVSKFDTALTAALSRLHGFYESASRR